MNVRIEIKLDTTPINKHREEMYAAAEYLTNDEDSIAILTLPKKSKAIVAEFTINKARQIDIVDRIGKRFRENIDNYCDSSISFPKTLSNSSNIKRKTKRKQYTAKQGQYLSFIYYYTKLNGYPPAEADVQRYFKTTPASIHNMIVQLEKQGFIQRKPREPRSIKLLLSRQEIPDLEWNYAVTILSTI